MSSRTQLQAIARAAARRHGIPPRGFVAQIGAESDWDPQAVNPESGAMGLAQFMPATWTEWGQGLDPFEPAASLDAGARYMAWIPGWLESQDVPGTWPLTLASYNWGIGNVRDTYRAHGAAWLEHVPAETRHYVQAIGPSYEPPADTPAPVASSRPLVIIVIATIILWSLR